LSWRTKQQLVYSRDAQREESAGGNREENLTDQAVGQHATIQGFREWMALIVMLSGGVMLGFVVAAMSPVAHEAALYFAKSGDGDMVAQMIVTVPSIGVIIGGPLSGWAIARTGARNFMLTALAIFGVAGSAGLYLDDAMALLVSRFVLGLATAGIVTSMITMISEHFTPEARARILGYQSASGALAGVLTIFVAGQIGQAYGWRAPFAIYLLSFVALILGWFFLPATARRVPTAGKTIPVDAKQLTRLWPIYLMIIPMFIAVYMPNIQVSFLLRDDGIVGPSIQSYVILTGAFTVAVSALCFGPIRRRISGAQILLACFVFQGVGIAVMGLSHAALPIAIGCGILGIGTGISNPLISDVIVARTTPEMRSRAIGLSYTARYSGDFINPLIVHPLGLALGLHTAFVVVGGLFLAGVAIAAVWRQAMGKTAPA
jgi:MFS family permease